MEAISFLENILKPFKMKISKNKMFQCHGCYGSDLWRTIQGMSFRMASKAKEDFIKAMAGDSHL